jgi:hypothetical protein
LNSCNSNVVVASASLLLDPYVFTYSCKHNWDGNNV